MRTEFAAGGPVNVAALFVRRDSHYKAMPGVDCYDEDRDALTWQGGCPGIFHPPCRAWGKLAHMTTNVAPWEMDLGRWSVTMARRYGGVVEHPVGSRLFADMGCCRTIGVRDKWGGVVVSLHQSDFGHRALKPTLLYIVGADVPALPFQLITENRVTVENMRTPERERTPEQFAALLVYLARQAVLKVAA